METFWAPILVAFIGTLGVVISSRYKGDKNIVQKLDQIQNCVDDLQKGMRDSLQWQVQHLQTHASICPIQSDGCGRAWNDLNKGN